MKQESPVTQCPLKDKVVDEAAWLALHYEHCTPEKRYNDIQPPSYRIYTLICRCGAKLIGVEDKSA